MTKITIIKGDITTQEVDAIVNAANQSLRGGGGVDGAIHRAAGRQLFEECITLGGCETGEVKITKGYNLPAKYVIHTVGPVYGRKGGLEPELLKACYRNSLHLAKEKGLKTIAFPSISTGVYMYPILEATEIALTTVKEFIDTHPETLEEVRFVVFSDDHVITYNDIFFKVNTA